MKYFFYFLAFALIFYSCSKEEPEINCKDLLYSNKHLVKIISTSDVPSNFKKEIVTLIYDSNYKCLKIIDSTDDKLICITNLIYSNKGNLLQERRYNDSDILERKVLFEYNTNNKVTKVTVVPLMNGVESASSYFIFEYDYHCNLVKESVYSLINNIWNLDGTIVIKWAGGNIQKLYHYDSDNTLIKEETLEYDNKLSYHLSPGFSIYDYCKNNVIKIISKNYWGDDQITYSTVIYLMEYNEYGLPSHITQKFDDGHLGNDYITFEYD
jgi:hypothetical protein